MIATNSGSGQDTFNGNRWIPMGEREPEEGQLCLVYAPSADPQIPLRQYSEWRKVEGWIYIVDAWRDKITFWMPYPDTNMLPHE